MLHHDVIKSTKETKRKNMSDEVGKNNNEVSPKTVMFSLPGNDGTTGSTQKGGKDKELEGTLFF